MAAGTPNTATNLMALNWTQEPFFFFYIVFSYFTLSCEIAGLKKGSS